MESTPTSETDPTVGEPIGDHPVRQLLHAATGDRDREAAALSADADVSPDDARDAVRRVHGDVSDDVVPADHDVATADDVDDVAGSE